MFSFKKVIIKADINSRNINVTLGSIACCVTSELKSLQKPADDSAAVDALSGDFDTPARAPDTPKHSKVGHFLLITCKQ